MCVCVCGKYCGTVRVDGGLFVNRRNLTPWQLAIEARFLAFVSGEGNLQVSLFQPVGVAVLRQFPFHHFSSRSII